MQILNRNLTEKKVRPIRVVQFGEGNFLRGFVDYMIDIANERGKFDGDIVLIKPIEWGSLEVFHAQDCQYTVSLRGIADGEAKISNRMVTSVADAVSAHDEYDKYMKLAEIDTLRFVVSNTTEAGIVLDSSDRYEMTPPKSFPGKLVKFLFHRFTTFHGDMRKGLIMLPVELIDDNGIMLKKCVMELIDLWNLGEVFRAWVEEACVFTSTLVDRIVTGYPKDNEQEEWEKLGYEDRIMVTGEPFALWVIENPAGNGGLIDVCKEFPLPEAGLPVIFTDDQKPYKQRKVRILNGAHTSFSLASYLAGNNFVKESMDDEDIRKFMFGTIFEEVVPSLIYTMECKNSKECTLSAQEAGESRSSIQESDGSNHYRQELEEFAREVINRFQNPYVKHSLLSISLNSVPKWRARCMPSFLAYAEQTGNLPERLTFSLAALMAFYNGTEIRGKALISHRNREEYEVMDDMPVLEFFSANNANLSEYSIVKEFLGREDFFGQDLNQIAGLTEKVAAYLTDIKTNGMRASLCKII